MSKIILDNKAIDVLTTFITNEEPTKSNLIPENIKKDVTILGVTGTYEGEQPTPTTYNITTNITNGTYSGDNIIEIDGTATVTLVADSGYNLPTSITVVGASYTYDDTNGEVALSNPASAVAITAVCEAEQPQPTGLTPFQIGDIPEAGDIIAFDTSIDDTTLLNFCKGLTYDGNGICWLVADQTQQGGLLIAYQIDTTYAIIVAGGVSGMTGWASEANDDMGLAKGWQGLDGEGKVSLSSAAGFTVGYLNPANGWNGVIAGFEKKN